MNSYLLWFWQKLSILGPVLLLAMFVLEFRKSRDEELWYLKRNFSSKKNGYLDNSLKRMEGQAKLILLLGKAKKAYF